METPVISAKNVTVTYGSYTALKNVSFSSNRGEFVAIVGKSGTGKSTFLNALAGFIPFEGVIGHIDRFGYVFQIYALFPWMTVEQNVGFGLGHMNSSDRRLRVHALLRRIEMLEYRNRYPHHLSGGETQRVALARALAPDPDVLLMDEPYGALDHHTREKMQEWLLEVWADSKKTVIFVTHFIEEAVFLADRVVVVSEGSFAADISIPFLRPRSPDIRFTEAFLDMKHAILDYMG